MCVTNFRAIAHAHCYEIKAPSTNFIGGALKKNSV